MMGALARLKHYRNDASPTERELIDRVVANPEIASGLSIHELSRLCYTSPSTITRLCKKLGLQGYREFQQLLVYDLAVLRESERELVEDLSPLDTTGQTLRKVLEGAIASLEITEGLNSPSTYDECVDLMCNARTINLFGMGASLMTARDLYYKLIRIGVACNLVEDWHGQLLCASNGGPDTLSIAVSYSGGTAEVNTCAARAKERGGKVIAITGFDFDSELVGIADIVLFVASNEPLMRSGAMASRISQLGVVDVLFKAFVNRDYDRYAGVLESNQIRKSIKGMR